MTWNVQHARSDRAIQQAAWIAAQPAEVVVLTEVTATDGGRALDETLRGYGFTTSYPAVPGDYGTMIASRIGEQEACKEIQPSYLPHRCVTVRLHTGDKIIGVAGIYVPSRGARDRRNIDKRAFQQAITKLLPCLAEAIGSNPTVIAGDLNIVEPGHQPRLKVFGAWEYDFYRAFTDAGYGDAFRYVHPELTDHSWYGRSSNGYRIDHIFCAPLSGITDCRYLHQPRLAGLSDHSAMTVAIALPGTARGLAAVLDDGLTRSPLLSAGRAGRVEGRTAASQRPVTLSVCPDKPGDPVRSGDDKARRQERPGH